MADLVAAPQKTSDALKAMAAARLHVEIEKRLPSLHLRVQLAAATGVLVLFGPSGAGKTTTLNAIAGLVTPEAGEIMLDGKVFFRRHRPGPPVNVPARERRIGYVFQHFALFPHLTALENVAYALWRRPNGRARAWELLERMRLTHVADHYPHELSGGQQQRVAIARALATDPHALLLDEPFSALDAAVRERLQRELRALQEELQLVVLYVTHRLEDAFAMGDQLAVMRDGRIEQQGPIEDVFRRPANQHVAEIMGIRNVFYAKVVDDTPDGLLLDWDGIRLEAPHQPGAQGLAPGRLVMAYIRPEDVKVLYPDRPLTSAVSHNHVPGRIVETSFNASFRTLRVELPNRHALEISFPAYTYTPLRLRAGDDIMLSLRKEALVLLGGPYPSWPPGTGAPGGTIPALRAGQAPAGEHRHGLDPPSEQGPAGAPAPASSLPEGQGQAPGAPAAQERPRETN
jgi:molybdate transport system ATP-binding protein